MSHLEKIAVKFKDQACLIEALQRLGFYPLLHDKPVHLFGYRGDKREEVAHIVVSRNQISRASSLPRELCVVVSRGAEGQRCRGERTCISLSSAPLLPCSSACLHVAILGW